VALVLVAAGGGFCPPGMTMGVDLVFPFVLSVSSSLLVSDFNCGGQSTDVGGQLCALPDPDDPGGVHPAPAPKSPAVVQSALATAAGTTAATSETATAAIQMRSALIS
jgi:hypothetical protein